MKKTFAINGMKCSHCRAAVQQAISQLPGVRDVVVSLEQSSVTVEYDETRVSAKDFCDAVSGSGNFSLKL